LCVRKTLLFILVALQEKLRCFYEHGPLTKGAGQGSLGELEEPRNELLTDALAVRVADIVDCKNTMVSIIVVIGEEDRDTAAVLAAMVAELSEEALDLTTRQATGVLEERTE
jgi:hypothetical protein